MWVGTPRKFETALLAKQGSVIQCGHFLPWPLSISGIVYQASDRPQLPEISNQLCENIQNLELRENIWILDVLTKLCFWPVWPWKWPWRTILTLNLKSVALIPYVSLFSVICIVVLATYEHFVRRRRLIRKKEPHVDLLPQVKTKK